ncbi:MAG TPA: BBE domain-containing protein, partial [Acidimicrobiales bacterium]
SSLRQVSPNTTTAQAVVGAGAHLIEVYGQLAAAQMLIPAGSCPTVGITGLALGGGIGVLGRAYGMTSDNIDSLQMVTADGVLRTCSPNQHEDLYWASRGGGGGNFGIVTSFTFKTHPIPAINLFTLEWAWGDAGAVLESWMQWLPNTPKELWSNCQLDSNGSAGGGGVVKVTGVFAGPTAACSSALAPLLSAAGSTPSYQFVGPEDYFRAMTIEGGCEGESVSQCDAVTRSAFVAKSSYINAALSGAGVSSIIDAISSLATTVPSVGGGIVFDGYGGVINDVAADATAFVHRAAVACAQYSVTYGSGNPPDSIAAGVTAWLNETQTRFAPYATGSYQNYIDPTLPNWAEAYYGSNLPRLSQIKRKWDSDDYFHFAQSIPLSA